MSNQGTQNIVNVAEVQGDIAPGFRRNNQAFILARIGKVESARAAISSLRECVLTSEKLLAWLDSFRPVNAVVKANRLLMSSGQAASTEDAAFASAAKIVADLGKEVWVNLGFTYEGLVKLRPTLARKPVLKDLRLARSRLRRLLPSSADWDVCGGRKWPHLIVNIASDDLCKLNEKITSVTSLLETHGLEVVNSPQRGTRIERDGERNQEHFGFRDGISTYAIRGMPSQSGVAPRVGGSGSTLRVPASNADVLSKAVGWKQRRPAGPKADVPIDTEMELEEPGLPLVWPGQFLLGHQYSRQNPDSPTNPEAPAICADDDDAFFANGSFLVWLRLHQDVAAFWDAARAHAADLTKQLGFGQPPRPDAKPLLAKHAAAMLVGRWRDGTPLVQSPVFEFNDPNAGAAEEKKDIKALGLNHFSYLVGTPAEPTNGLPEMSADLYNRPGGAKCPLTAHIRKTNPRVANSLATAILRRSIPFGPPVEDPENIDPAEKDADRGLFFVCYQSSISEQFETIQRDWVGKIGNPEQEGGLDWFSSPEALAGDRIRTGVADPYGQGTMWMNVSTGWVDMRGGAYFFVPSMHALELLASP